ncbi:hypothetical protein DXG01_014530 [Tephrocybe rancida]|nr:hypothetical protein DXG01_014530 [Tephrocybe rancida]
MAPKSSSTGKEKLIDDDDEVLQAVILADSFNKRFRPLTARKPRCLLPICNAPLLDWTFESLALAGVQEIFVICRSHADQVKAAINESKWSKPGSGIKIVPILTAKETFSPGDAMRDIYTRGLVTSDFVLVMGDLVSNIRIDEVVRVHKERRKTNKDAIMTMVVKEGGARHRTKARGDSSVFVLDPETSECLYYEPVTAYPPTTLAHVPREALAAHPELEIRNDLIDCSIDVCSVEVPSLFQDNFDYLDIRRDFVHGVLTSDLLMKNIHCYVAKDGYAARVKDTKSYESVSKDILSRWTFPLVPDDNHPSGHIYDHERGNKYIAKDHTVVLARTCKIGNNTLIGPSTQISENAQIVASVIGRNCSIGTGTIVRNSYIFDGTVIGSDCVIERSIIGSGVSIRDSSIVQRGSLVGDGVIVGPSARLRPYERLSKKREAGEILSPEDEEDEDSDLEDVEALQDSIPKTLGKDSNAIVWPTTPPHDADEDEIAHFKNERFMRLGDNASDLDDSDDGSESSSSESGSEDDSDFDSDSQAFSVPSGTSLPLNLGLPDGSPMAESEFQIEVKQSLERAFAEGHSVDNAAVELKTLRMASNVPLTRVREAVVGAIVEKIQIVNGGPAAQRKEISTVVSRWGELIDRIGGVDPIETVTALQILAAFYQDDIVEEDDIRKWHSLSASKGLTAKDGEIENMKKCWTIGTHMIKQFNEQESEDDSDEDDQPGLTGNAPKQESDDDESGSEESGEEGDAAKTTDKSAGIAATVATDKNAATTSSEEDSSDGSDEESGEDESEQEPEKVEECGPTPTEVESPNKVPVVDAEESSKEEESEEEAVKPLASPNEAETSEEEESEDEIAKEGAHTTKVSAATAGKAEETSEAEESEEEASNEDHKVDPAPVHAVASVNATNNAEETSEEEEGEEEITKVDEKAASSALARTPAQVSVKVEEDRDAAAPQTTTDGVGPEESEDGESEEESEEEWNAEAAPLVQSQATGALVEPKGAASSVGVTKENKIDEKSSDEDSEVEDDSADDSDDSGEWSVKPKVTEAGATSSSIVQPNQNV